MGVTAQQPTRSAHRTGDDRGFTLIELLVVMLVVSILAAIAIPVFLSQQALAQNAAATSDLVNLRKAMVSYSIDHDGAYTNNASALEGYGASQSTQSAPLISVTGSRFCVQLASDSSTTFFVTDRANVREGTCATSGDPAFTP